MPRTQLTSSKQCKGTEGIQVLGDIAAQGVFRYVRLAFLVSTRLSWIFSDLELKLPKWYNDLLVLPDRLRTDS